MPAVDIWVAAKPAAPGDERRGLDAKLRGETAHGGNFDQVMQATLAPHAQKSAGKNSSHSEKPPEKVSQKKNDDQKEAETDTEPKATTPAHQPAPVDATEPMSAFFSLPLALPSFSDFVNVSPKGGKSEAEPKAAPVSATTETGQTATASSQQSGPGAKPGTPTTTSSTTMPAVKTSWAGDMTPVKAVDPQSTAKTPPKPEAPTDSPPEAPAKPDLAADLAAQGAKSAEKEPDQDGINSAEMMATDAGTGVAITDSPMKNQQKTNKIAGSDVKVLPVGQDGEARVKNLPPQLAVTPVQAAENRGTDLNFAFSNGNNQTATNGSATVLNMVDLPSLSDARMRALDRAQDMVTLHAMRLVESKADSLSVVIKPAVGTELSLNLHLDSNGIHAEATVTRGDHQFLNQHWQELQQRLEQRGIRLAPLGSEGDFSSNGNGQYQQQSSQEDAAQQASAFAEFASVSATSGGASARLVPIHDGWESWA